MPRINNPYERQHIANLAQYAKQIDAIYRTAAQEAAAIAAIIPDFESSRVFSFNDYPMTHQRIQALLSRLNKSTETAVVNGINAEWTLANNKNNELSQLVFGNNVGRLTPAQYRRYFSTNDNARQAFLQRKEQGLNLSERVWQYTNAFRREIELGLDICLRNGLSADETSRELRQYLKYPDKLFRRVRDEHGNLVLSKRAAEFHPGQGVYRSSYKNARRLAVTETNIAYRSADYERYQQLDFVVGIEIRLSNNHTIHDSKGNLVPLYDICDELCGRYPKDFKFTGWHPHCRCHVISILKTEEELMKENAAILAGKEPTEESVNRVADVPQNFRDWLKNNADRIKHARTIPHFMQDNGTVEKGVFTLKEFKGSTEIGTTIFVVPTELAKGGTYLGNLEEFDEDFFRLIDPNKPIKLTIENANKGSYSSFAGDEVVISNQDRCDASPYFRKSVIYHEYGHCIDAQRTLWQDKDLLDMRARQIKELNTLGDYTVSAFNWGSGGIKDDKTLRITLAEYVQHELTILDNSFLFFAPDDLKGTEWEQFGMNKCDLREQILNTADTLKSLIAKYGWGHDRSYFLKTRMSETEYLAHAFENTFVGNQVFKKLMPTIYDEMVAYIKGLKPL